MTTTKQIATAAARRVRSLGQHFEVKQRHFTVLPRTRTPVGRGAEFAMVNYETKSPESLKVLKSPVAPPARKEGIT